MADTVYKLTHTGEQIDSAIDNAVRSDAQILTSEQQTQARTNIGAASAASAASAADLTTETNERITADTGVRGLTATVEATSTASQAYAIGAYFVYNGLLYKCTVAIAQGKTITPGTNCTATTAGAEISTLNQNLALIQHGTVTLPDCAPQTQADAVITFSHAFSGNYELVFSRTIPVAGYNQIQAVLVSKSSTSATIRAFNDTAAGGVTVRGLKFDWIAIGDFTT